MVKHLSILACGLALAACSSSGELMRTATPTVPLQFESEPPGAEVKTSGGQTCRTPCALAIPAADFQVTFSLNGFATQTVPVKLLPPDDMRGSEEMGLTSNPPRFSPSPVAIEMQKAAPPRRAPAKKPRVGSRIDLRPTRAPSVMVSVLNVRPDPSIAVGTPVLAATSKLGTAVNVAAVEKQALAAHARDGGNNISIAVYPSPGSLP